VASLEERILNTHPFNSTLETGIRALVVLEAFYPRHCDLMEMTWFDHLIVHTGDIDGQDVPESLHPDLPNRTGELLARISHSHPASLADWAGGRHGRPVAALIA